MAIKPYVEPPHTYDAIYAKHAQGTPLAFLRALTFHESRMNPTIRPMKDGKPISSAVGLFQNLKSTVETYNKATGSHFVPPSMDASAATDMTDPEKNTIVGTWLIRTIIEHYRQNTRSLRENWDDPKYIALLVYGYVWGWSNKQGVASVVKRMEDSGIAPDKITVANVDEVARKLYPNDIRFQVNPGLMNEVMSVVADYYRDPTVKLPKDLAAIAAADHKASSHKTVSIERSGAILGGAALATILAIALSKK